MLAAATKTCFKNHLFHTSECLFEFCFLYMRLSSMAKTLQCHGLYLYLVQYSLWIVLTIYYFEVFFSMDFLNCTTFKKLLPIDLDFWLLVFFGKFCVEMNFGWRVAPIASLAPLRLKIFENILQNISLCSLHYILVRHIVKLSMQLVVMSSLFHSIRFLTFGLALIKGPIVDRLIYYGLRNSTFDTDRVQPLGNTQRKVAASSLSGQPTSSSLAHRALRECQHYYCGTQQCSSPSSSSAFKNLRAHYLLPLNNTSQSIAFLKVKKNFR